jgi:hypothetical protein
MPTEALHRETFGTVLEADPHQALGQFAVQIHLDSQDQEKFPIGAHGMAAIHTSGGGFAMLRRISIRAHAWPILAGFIRSMCDRHAGDLVDDDPSFP